MQFFQVGIDHNRAYVSSMFASIFVVTFLPVCRKASSSAPASAPNRGLTIWVRDSQIETSAANRVNNLGLLKTPPPYEMRIGRCEKSNLTAVTTAISASAHAA